MSSVQHLREFIGERLTAAATEIFAEFERTIVQYEEELGRHRRLLDVCWKPHIHLNRTDLPRQHNLKDNEIQTDPYDQDESSSLGQEVQVKVELQEVNISQHGERLILKEEADSFMITPIYEESQHDESESFTHQHLPSSCPATESGDLMGSSHVEAGSVTDSEQKTETSLRADMKTADLTPLPSNLHDFSTATKSLTCDVCGKTFLNKYNLKYHYRIHTGNQNHACTMCQKKFCRKSHLIRHIKTHSVGNPYSCQVCGKCFTSSSNLSSHMKTHKLTDMKTADLTPRPSNRREFSTATKSLTCDVCGKTCLNKYRLNDHYRIHTSIRNHACTMCHKTFYKKHHLICHIRTHTGEKPYSCQICGRCFTTNSNLSKHVKTHSSKKPSFC